MQDTRIKTAAIVPAAGSGSRMGLPLPKQFMQIKGVPVLIRTLHNLMASEDLDTVIVALPPEHIESTGRLLDRYFSKDRRAGITLVKGGRTRQDSVQAGLSALQQDTDVVIVHDGARPFISPDVVRRCITEAAAKGAAIAAVQVRDTIKRVAPDGSITATVDREGLWQAQTPQAARYELLSKALSLARETGFQGTDEASVLEHAGIPVVVVPGNEKNIKITRPEDLKIAEGIVEDDCFMRIGHGFDAHRFGLGRLLVLGGVTIPSDLGLEGHSDADVLTHALIDSLFGAMGEGDIGGHFPDKDPQYKNISSLVLLQQAVEKMRAKNFSICNADITVICQRPRLAPYIMEMRQKIAAACGVKPEAVNIKATTTEMMGFTGRGEGIAAHAVVLLHSAQKEHRQ